MRQLRNNDIEIPTLNLNPMMDLFVGLIPFLILSAAFIRYSGVHADLPSAGQAIQQESKKSEELDLSFEVKEKVVVVSGYSKGFAQKLDKVNAQFEVEDSAKLEAYIKELKNSYPKIGASLFYASANTSYETAIGVLNVMRGSKVLNNIVMAAGMVE